MMKYLGSKRTIAKSILPLILQKRKDNQLYAEPFVGGANIFENIEGPKKQILE